MASEGDSIFNRLRDKTSIKQESQRAQDVADRSQAQALKSRERQDELVLSNSTLPVVVSEVRVGSINNTRRGFLDGLFQPLINAGREQPYTLSEALEDIGKAHSKLNKLDIFKEPVGVYINNSEDPTRPEYPVPISVLFQAQEMSRYNFKTGTEIGNQDGSGYINGLFRNLFGGAEMLRLDLRRGWKTRSSQSAVFTSPIAGNPDLQFEVTALNTANLKPWASHEEILRGGHAAIKYLSSSGNQHALTYTSSWRQLTSLAENASKSIREEAGDSLKSSVTYSWMTDSRVSALATVHGRVLPYTGHYAKTTAEVAGAGGLGGDVAFVKLAAESQVALPIFRPESGFALSASLRGGILHPIPMGLFSDGNAPVKSSRFHDRFQLGGTGDIRGFRLSGVGPRDGNDALGGDVFAAGGVSLTGPFPNVSKDSPIRWQLFANFGRLIGIPSGVPNKSGTSSPGSEKDWQVVGGTSFPFKAVAPAIQSAVKDLANGLPTTSAGVGVVYAHPLARFEFNFTLPIALRQGEESRKGFGFGFGMEMM